MNKNLTHYQVAVQHPGVSGFEVLDMLMVRDELMQQLTSLTPKENAQLVAADQALLAHIAEFYAELTQITSLEYERQQRKPMPAQWWWYLDVLLQLPEPSAKFSEPALMPA
jgi:hypothetical protein